MSADLARSRDRAVHAMRTVAVVVLLLGLTLTGALAGVFARQNPPSGGTDAAGTGSEPAAVPGGAGQPVLVVVHEPARTPDGVPGSAPGGAVPAAEPAPAAPVAPAPAPVPTVAAPPAPVETAATSSGSGPG